jgi:hypothetical protein
MLPTTCCNPCPTSTTENIPGPEGTPGTDGAPGAAGVSSTTFTTANFNLPGSVGSNVTFAVANSTWMVVGSNIVAGDGTNFGTFKVVSLPSTTSVQGQWLGYPADSVAGTLINSGATVSPGGSLPTLPLNIANGGTGVTTKAAAQVAFGLGQDITEISGAGIGYVLTNSPATISGITVTVPATGLYLILASASIDFVGVTFVASRTVTLTALDTTSSTTLADRQAITGAATTQDYPTFEYSTPFKTALLTAGDIIALQISINTVPSAGTATVNEASLALVPLALS